MYVRSRRLRQDMSPLLTVEEKLLRTYPAKKSKLVISCIVTAQVDSQLAWHAENAIGMVSKLSINSLLLVSLLIP